MILSRSSFEMRKKPVERIKRRKKDDLEIKKIAFQRLVKEIVQEYRKGYKIGTKVIRHSMVIVAN